MIAFRTPVADCFVFYISRSPNEEVQVSHQGFPYPSTNGVAGPRSTIAKHLFGNIAAALAAFGLLTATERDVKRTIPNVPANDMRVP